jgi:E3 ubiquitin-protein ligase RNF13
MTHSNKLGLLLLVIVFIMEQKTTPVHGSITVYDFKNSTLNSYDALTARFGPRLPDEGFFGFIVHANPKGACTPIEPPPKNVSYVEPNQWIALILRTPGVANCSFDLKVYNAERAGYSAVIVYNSESDMLIRMSPSGDYMVNIPSMFVGHSSGLELVAQYTWQNGSYVMLTDDDQDLAYLLIPFVCVVTICFLVAVIIVLVKLVLHCIQVRKNRFP